MKILSIKNLIVAFLFLVSYNVFCNDHQCDTVFASDNLYIIKIADNVYVHVSYVNAGKWGRVGSNGMILISNSQAALFDTPMDIATTKLLVKEIKNVLKADIKLFIPNHWHSDCIGGLKYLNSLKIDSYSNIMTYNISKKKHLPLTNHTFKDSLTLNFDGIKIICKYIGKAHAADNIICAIPDKKIIFAGCMLKDLSANNLGNLEDASPSDWPATMNNLRKISQGYKILIPGHGNYGGTELIDHTMKLLQNAKE